MAGWFRPPLKSPAAAAAALGKTASVVGTVAPPDPDPAPGPATLGQVTYYARSFAGGPLGCGGGRYDPADPTIAATQNGAWPCGTRLQLTGPAGVQEVVRRDTCGGCGPTHLDLSEAGFRRVCGELRIGRCAVTIRGVH